jgi:aspartyl-tRNA(Asn)/glutamyl-tRNA(Gln) amidotransferase subunit C
MPIGRHDVEHIATLARLRLEEVETERLLADLARILKYVEQLAELDTEAVPPTAQVSAERAPLRDDEVRPGISREQALAEAPRSAHGGFAVPAFVED